MDFKLGQDMSVEMNRKAEAPSCMVHMMALILDSKSTGSCLDSQTKRRRFDHCY